MAKLSAQGKEVRGAPPEQLNAFVRKETPRWAKVINGNNIKSGDRLKRRLPRSDIRIANLPII